MNKLDKIILGTVQFGLNYGINNSKGKPSKQKVTEILDLAYKSGIKTLDTAEAYGNSHQVISDYHGESINRFKIISKYKKDAIGLSERLIDRVKKHLITFKIDQLEAYLFHDYNEFLELVKYNESEIKFIVEQKLVKKIGVSVYSNEQVEKVLRYPFVKLIQLPFNLLDNDNKRKDVLKRAKSKGVEIHTRSAFLQGLFFKEINLLPEYFKPIKHLLIDVKNICKKEGLSISELALNYPLSKVYIDNVLIGVDSKEQLLSNIESLEKNPDKCFKIIDGFSITDNNILNPSNWIK